MTKEFKKATFSNTKNLSNSQKKLNDQLYLSAKNQDVETVIKLLKQGADPFETNEEQETTTTYQLGILMDYLQEDKLQKLIRLLCDALKNRHK